MAVEQPVVCRTRARKPGVHASAVESVGRRIVSGELPPGTALPNAGEYARQLGMSRSVLREAMRVLEEKGLIELRQKRGTLVRPRSDWLLLDADVLRWLVADSVDDGLYADLTEVREIVEPRAASLAAERATSADLAQIGEALDRMRAASDRADDGFVEADLAFHGAILRATRNDLLRQMTETISAALRASRMATTAVPGSSPRSLLAHEDVLAAIRGRSPDDGDAAMRRLINETRQDIEAFLVARRLTRSTATAPGRGTRSTDRHRP
jgi:DNA-binding FadR family transcriptional regulator